jgi:hypothetical protein
MEKRRKNHGKVNGYIHVNLLQRKEGEYFTLYTERVEDYVSSFISILESMYRYLNLLSRIEEDLKKKNTTFLPQGKTAICLTKKNTLIVFINRLCMGYTI